MNGQSLWWPVLARNKKSITLNLREKEGQDILRRLIEQADILVENFRPGTLEKWGLDYASLSAVNPKLIMVRVSGFGQTGPYAPRAGYGSIGEAMGGLRHIVGEADRPPSRVGISIGDSLAATHATLGALAALRAREVSGRGQVVDCAIYEAVLTMMESTVTEYYKTGYVRERTGSRLPNIAPSNVYPTADGEILIAANQDTVFRRLCEVMGREEWIDDPRYRDHVSRGQNEVELDEKIGAWSVNFSSSDLLTTAKHDEGACLPAKSLRQRTCWKMLTLKQERRLSPMSTPGSESWLCKTCFQSSPPRPARCAALPQSWANIMRRSMPTGWGSVMLSSSSLRKGGFYEPY
ncbi:putative CoA-transferase family III protein [Nitritalea halalkaliphila LW7]|uniref:Putative CoA-transferase family III protein n=1 Tax=Nitritalea halalkaliphila LW7 TaxID=1189621 RepID=I5C7C4_9BACT|nr:putative CoA-transferase family III protein [Nitritalea halalkaliphila LW7]